jgi:hypothetical protein
MKCIDIPQDVTEAKVSGKDEPIKLDLSFKKFLLLAMENYPTAGKGYGNIKKANTITTAVEKAEKTITLDDDHLAMLKSAIEEMPWNPAAARAMIPYFEALEKAHDPEKK